jgi:hypothetical protein
MYSTRQVYAASSYQTGSATIQSYATSTASTVATKKAPLLPAISGPGSRSGSGAPSSAIVPSEDQDTFQRPSPHSTTSNAGGNISITISDSNTAPMASVSSQRLQSLFDAKVQSTWLRYNGKPQMSPPSASVFCVKYAMLNPPKPKPMAEDALTVDVIPASGVPPPTLPSSPPMSTSARADGKTDPSAVFAVPPPPLTRSDRKWMYCAQVAEAARYQRQLYTTEGLARKELIRIIREVEEGVRAANSTFEMGSPHGGVGSGAGGRISGTRGGRTPHSPSRTPTRRTNYMLVAPRALRDLVSDVHILLAPSVTKDMTQSVAQQLWKLKMFQASGFPLEVDIPSPRSTPSTSPTTSPANQESR